MRRHTLVTTVLDAGVNLRDVQVAARHARLPDPAKLAISTISTSGCDG